MPNLGYGYNVFNIYKILGSISIKHLLTTLFGKWSRMKIHYPNAQMVHIVS